MRAFLRNAPISYTIKNMNGRRILISILLVAALLRLTVLSTGDTISDEIGYGFRAVGMLDFDEAAEQTTPLEWFDPFIPSWTKLSFHDHPPLVFLVQHVFIGIFGENNFGLRISSALFGIASVYLLYLIGKHLYGERVGLLAAALFAVTVNHVALSRMGLQEAQVVFFILLTIYLFLRALQNDTYFLWAGLALGLSFLTKYTTFVLVPILGTYLFLTHPRLLLNKKLLLGALLALAIFSPVLIYNYQLYQTKGHFDFQLSYIFKQNPAVWQNAPGKEEFPTLASRVSALLPNLFRFYSQPFLGAFALAAAAFFFFLFRNALNTLRAHLFLLLTLGWSLVLVFFIGPSFRFLSPLTAFMALGVGTFMSSTLPNRTLPSTRASLLQKGVSGSIAALIILEVIYTINSQLLPYPLGKENWMFSRLRYENYNWGYNALGTFLESELAGTMPAVAFEPKYNFIAKIHDKALKEARRAGLRPYPALIVYDRNIHSQPQLWLLDRLQIYHAWPVISIETYREFLQREGADYFATSGIRVTYVIIPTERVPLKKPRLLTTLGIRLEEELKAKQIAPYRIIQNARGEDVFRVYKF